MNNLSSYCGLVDARINASDKELPVCIILHQNSKSNFKNVDGFSRGEFGSINAADCSCSLMDFISEWT